MAPNTFPALPWAPFRDTNTYESAKAEAIATATAKPKRPPMYPELQGLESKDRIEDTRNGKRYTVKHTATGSILLRCADDIRFDTDKHGDAMLVGAVQSVELKPETVALRIRQGRYLVTHYEAVTVEPVDPMEARNKALASVLLARFGYIVYSLGTVHLARLTADSTLYDIHTLIHPLGPIGSVTVIHCDGVTVDNLPPSVILTEGMERITYELIESPVQRLRFIERKRRAIASVAPFLSSRIHNTPEPEETEHAQGIARRFNRLEMPSQVRQTRTRRPVPAIAPHLMVSGSFKALATEPALYPLPLRHGEGYIPECGWAK